MSLDQNLPKIYAQALFDALHEVKPGAQEKVLKNFTDILKERNHFFLFEDIAKEFEKLAPSPKFQENRQVIEELNYHVKQNRDNIISEEEGRIVIKIDE